MSTVLNKNLIEINCCPLCGSKKNSSKYLNYPNRYSEQVALELKISEKKIISKMKNLMCSNCGLIYKKYWFSESFLFELYNKLIPVHPKGWENRLKNFTKKNFSNIVKKFLDNRESRFKREIIGFLDSIDFKNKSDEKLIKNFKFNILKNNFKKIKSNSNQIKKLILKPKDFSRFTNFESEKLFNYVLKKNKKINTFAEIGCPLWGMYSLAAKKKFKLIFFKGKSTEFWGRQCKYKGIKCIDQCKKKFKIDVKKKVDLPIDYIGIYLYLDHVINLKDFLDDIFKHSNSIGIILEDMRKFSKTKKLAIQHFTSITTKTVQFLSKKYNFTFFNDFKNIKNTKQNFYFFQKRRNENI